MEYLEYISIHPIAFAFSVPIYRAAVVVEKFIRKHDRLAKMRYLIQAVFVLPEESSSSS